MATTLKDYLVKFVADVTGLNNASQATNKLSNDLKLLTKQLAKSILGWGTLIQAVVKFANKVKTAVKWTIEMNQSLEAQAKTLNKTTEKARAHLVALKVMGKTMEEINKDASLKSLYDDLVKLGDAMALPQAAKGLMTLNDVINAWTKIKYVAYYALQWIWYYTQKYLKTPLEKIKNFLNGTADDASSKIKEWAKKASYYISKFINGVLSIIKTLKSVWDGLKNLWNSINGQGKSALALFISLLVLVTNKGLALKALFLGILLLFDDFMAMLRGDETQLSTDTWKKVLSFAYQIYNVVAKIVNTILKAINWVSRFTGGENIFETGLHVFTDEEIEEKVGSMTANAEEADKKRYVQQTASAAAEWLEGYDDSTATDEQRAKKEIVQKWYDNYMAAKKAMDSSDTTMAAVETGAATNVAEDNSTTNVTVNSQFYITDVAGAQEVAGIVAGEQMSTVQSAVEGATS